jgi:hypothetical protein
MARAFRQIRSQVLASFALALAFCLNPALSRAADLYMVSVGVNNAKGQVPLTAPAKDASAMTAWAQTQKNKLFARAITMTLMNDAATKKNVLANLTYVKNQAKAGDVIIFYNSSHGGNNKGKYILSMFDGTLQWSDVLAALDGSVATKIAILDTCDAGMAAGSGSLVVFASSRANQDSLDGTKNSLYTQYLLEGLRGSADTDHNGFISLAEAAAYASKMLLQYDKGKKAADQQNSVFTHPVSIKATMPLTKLTNGFIGNDLSIVGKVYAGSASTKDIGKLTFTLESDTRVVMHFARGTVNGTYTRTGKEITFRFPQVQTTYHGTVNGFQGISGSATDAKGHKWTFSVNPTN